MASVQSYLPLFVALIPILGSFAVMLAARRGERERTVATAATTLLTLAAALWQFALVRDGDVLSCGIRGCLGVGLRWRVDFVSACFSLVVAAVWFLSTVFAREYMAHEHSQTRFFSDSVFTLGTTLGVFVAGDLFTLFLFFELMTVSSYMLVIHEQNREAMSAGNVYLYMSVIGGLVLLGVVFILQYAAGHTRFEPMLAALVEKGISPWLVFVLTLVGFGVKAGLIPLHIWLPRAHPVAPAPASALLSALMIKTGAYGFFRFLYAIFSAPDGDPLFVFQQGFGYAFMWIGVVTMFIGAVMGILAGSMKKVLAYSSISQMGYILFALGTGAFLGSHGAAALAGAWLHSINHAFFKSFLFLLAGAVFLHTGELDFDKLGGLGKRMPWAFGFFLVAAASITGIPGFNGYVSKVLIHEGILEAYHIKHWPSLLWLERIFVFTGGLTAAYITKLWLKVFVAKPKEPWNGVQDISLRHKFVFGVYTAIVVFIGTQAQRVVNALGLPVVKEISFNPGDVDHLTHVPYWSGHEMQSALVSYAIAAAVLVLLWRFGDRLRVPQWLSVEYLVYKPLYRAAVKTVQGFGPWQAVLRPRGFAAGGEAKSTGQAQALGTESGLSGAAAVAVVAAVVLAIFLWYALF